ncbi:MAG: 16S rRNA (cytosine(967)-C(5))-methyltransferase RsmB, partial [Clostridiales bacterium]|nr:16S rRNA (cytosine(967)-C(5))-methyltransferase RsmB [Clostridiales bacterium]
LLTFDSKPGKADDVLDRILKKFQIDPRDKSLATRIFYGVIQNKLLLDFYISSFSSLKLNKISPAVIWILRMGFYQISFMDRVPNSAVVNSCVAMTKRYANPRAASFVNAVLRKASSEVLPEPSKEDLSSYLSLKYSHPNWLVKRFLSLFGVHETEELLKMNNESAPISLRVNSLKTTNDKAASILFENGVSCKTHPLTDNCLLIENQGSLEEIDAVKNGFLYVQDFASQLSIEALKPTPGSNVIDLCASPGGKSLLCAQMMENQGQIFSFDINSGKTKMIEENARRLGVKIIKTEVSDALVFRDDLISTADFIVCDVPCSGFGVIRKKPDIRYKQESEIGTLPEIQKKILSNAAKYVKKGGTILYSTCTILPEENENIVNDFINSNSEYELEPFKVSKIVSESGMLLLLPYIHQTDGFFFAKIRRRK